MWILQLNKAGKQGQIKDLLLGGPNFGSERTVEHFCGNLLLTETIMCFSNCEHRSLFKGGSDPLDLPPWRVVRVFKQFSLGIVKFKWERSVVWRNDTINIWSAFHYNCRWNAGPYMYMEESLQLCKSIVTKEIWIYCMQGLAWLRLTIESLPKKPYHL